MKFRTTLIAALLLVAFGSYVYFFEYKKAEEEKKQEEEAKKVYSIDWDKLKGLKITNAHGTFVVEKVSKAVKEGGEAGEAEEWRIVEPIQTDAEDGTINGMVSTLKNVKVEQVVTESAEDLEPFGLEKPGIKIALILQEAEKAPPVLLVGGKSPIGYNSYAMREGENKVLLLSTHLVPSFEKNLYELRHKKLFAFKRDDVERLRILKGGDPYVEFVRKEKRWELVHPFRARAAETAVDRIVNKLTALRAQAFEAEEAKDLSSFGLDHPAWRVEVILKPDHALATLLIGGKHQADGKKLVYAKRGEAPVVVSLREDLLEAVDRAPEVFREKKVFPFKTWKIKKVELAWKGQDVTLEKKQGSKWWITAPIEARADSSRVSRFLSELSRLEAEAFLKRPEEEAKLAEYGLQEPLARVTLYEEPPVVSAGEKEEAPPKLGTFLLGKSEKGKKGYYATAEDDETIYAVKEGFYEDEFPDSMEALRSKNLLDFYRYQVHTIEYTGPEGEVVLERKGNTWRVKKPRSGGAEQKDVNKLLSELEDLEVDRFVDETPGDLSAWGLKPAKRVLRIRDDQGNELGAVLLSEQGPEGQEDLFYAKAGTEPWVGVISAEKRKSLLDAIDRFRGEG